MKTPQLDFLIKDIQANINEHKEGTQDDVDLLWEMLSIKLLLRDKLDVEKRCFNPNCLHGIVAFDPDPVHCKVCNK